MQWNDKYIFIPNPKHTRVSILILVIKNHYLNIIRVSKLEMSLISTKKEFFE